jgi:hypothetical protein
MIDPEDRTMKDALDQGLIDPATWRRGINDLKATIGRGTFHYTFFKAIARKAID